MEFAAIVTVAMVWPLCLTLGEAEAGAKLELQDGDRVVLLGGTFVERAQRYGYIETVLTALYPNRTVSFRNLGWSGDTVFAESRGIFDPPAVGYQRMIEQVKQIKPTIVAVAYGANESFAGPSGLEPFLKQLHMLLDDLEATGARIAIVLPHRHEHLGPPLPDPAQTNANLEIYADALKRLAEERRYPLVDFFSTLVPAQAEIATTPWTDNGQHLTEAGYRRAARIIEERLSPTSTLSPKAAAAPEPLWSVTLAPAGTVNSAAGGRLGEVTSFPTGLRFGYTDARLPSLALPEQSRKLQIRGLPVGRYALKIDGEIVLTCSAEEWAEGVSFASGPDFDRAETLRSAIIEKNRLYFHHWRPQNVTYLFGFRKHEQGQNAGEVAEFEKLVREKETEIRRLRVPVARTYEIVRVEK
jgi:lysophospholipase L1-like esterase